MKAEEMLHPDVDAYATAHTTPPSEAIAAIGRRTQEETPSPGMMSGLVEARLLESLVVATRARRVLEIGTFTGAGTLSMAARLPADGRITTIEADENVATMAAAHIAASPDAAKVEQIVGDARAIVQELDGPFDLVFIDAWKPDYAHYYEHVLPKVSEHGIIVADNVLWKGRVAGLGEEDEQTRSLRAFNDHVQADPRVHNALLTVGDGLLVIWRAPA